MSFYMGTVTRLVEFIDKLPSYEKRLRESPLSATPKDANGELLMTQIPKTITAEWFKTATGADPIQDDLVRSNCPKAGEAGHYYCGWNHRVNLPRFMNPWKHTTVCITDKTSGVRYMYAEEAEADKITALTEKLTTKGHVLDIVHL